MSIWKLSLCRNMRGAITCALLFSFLTGCGKTGTNHYNEGAEKYNRNDYQGSIAAFSESLKFELNEKPSRDEVYAWRAAAKLRIGETDGAMADCKAARKLNPQNKTALSVMMAVVKAKGEVVSIGGVSPDLWPNVLRDGHRRTPKDVPELIKALGSDSELIRTLAAKALGEIGPSARAALPALEKAKSDSVPFVRSEAEDAIKIIQK